jgi:hypothetical protein
MRFTKMMICRLHLQKIDFNLLTFHLMKIKRSLLGDANDVTVLEEKEQQIRKKKKRKIFSILDI